MDAYIVQPRREVLQILQLHFTHLFSLMLQIVEQFPKVTLISVERVARHVTLQLQVANVLLYYFFGR